MKEERTVIKHEQAAEYSEKNNMKIKRVAIETLFVSFLLGFFSFRSFGVRAFSVELKRKKKKKKVEEYTIPLGYDDDDDDKELCCIPHHQPPAYHFLRSTILHTSVYMYVRIVV